MAISTVLLVAASIPVATARPTLWTGTAPYLFGWGSDECYADPCQTIGEANETTGLMQLLGSAKATATRSSFATLADEGSLGVNVSALEVTAHLHLDADTVAQPENGSAYAEVSYRFTIDPTGCDCYTAGHGVLLDATTTSVHADRTVSAIVVNPDGDLPAGTVYVTFELDARAEASTPSSGASTTTFSATTPVGTVAAQVSGQTVSLSASTPAGSASRTVGPTAPTPAMAAYRANATLLSLEFGVPRHSAGGNLKRNQTYELAPAYDRAEFHDNCSGTLGCDASYLNATTGSMRLRVEGADMLHQRNYQTGTIFAHVDIPTGADSIKVTMDLDVAAAHAVARGVNGFPGAQIWATAYVEHLGCQAFDCYEFSTVSIVHEGSSCFGYCDPSIPANRTAELIPIELTLTNWNGGLMPPGALDLELDLYAEARDGGEDPLVAPAGLAECHASMDATLSAIHVEVDPAAWPPR